jgi:hypothetical protein
MTEAQFFLAGYAARRHEFFPVISQLDPQYHMEVDAIMTLLRIKIPSPS